MVEKDLAWEITQVADTIDPKSSHYNQLAHLAKTVRFDEKRGDMVWGDIPGGNEQACAHANAQDELHRLPLVVEPELLRLPPSSTCQQKDAAASQRGGRHAQLRLVQLPDAYATMYSCWPVTAM